MLEIIWNDPEHKILPNQMQLLCVDYMIMY